MFCFSPTAFPPKNLDIQFLLDKKVGKKEGDSELLWGLHFL